MEKCRGKTGPDFEARNDAQISAHTARAVAENCRSATAATRARTLDRAARTPARSQPAAEHWPPLSSPIAAGTPRAARSGQTMPRSAQRSPWQPWPPGALHARPQSAVPESSALPRAEVGGS